MMMSWRKVQSLKIFATPVWPQRGAIGIDRKIEFKPRSSWSCPMGLGASKVTGTTGRLPSNPPEAKVATNLREEMEALSESVKHRLGSWNTGNSEDIYHINCCKSFSVQLYLYNVILNEARPLDFSHFLFAVEVFPEKNQKFKAQKLTSLAKKKHVKRCGSGIF